MYSRLAAIFAAGALVVAGLATSTAHAAVAPTVLPPKVECGKVTLTVPAEIPVPITKDSADVSAAVSLPVLHLAYQVDRRRPQSVLVAPDRGTVQTINFPEDSGVHWVRYRLSDTRQWSGPVRVESDCRPNFERAEAPTVVQPECDATLGKLVIPADRGVFYKVRTADRPSRVVRAGSYDVRPGTYWVTAHAVRGYELRGDRVWRLVVNPAEVCPTPTPTPTVTVTPTVDPTPAPEPTPTVTETETEEPTPAPTVTQTVTDRRTVVVRDYLPVRVDTGLGGLATK